MLDKLKSAEVLDNINFDILQHFDSYCWIAGGALTNALIDKTPVDIDIFFASEADKIRAAEKLLDLGYTWVAKYPNGIRLEHQKRIYDIIFLKPTLEETISFFDFTICGVAIDKFKKIFAVENFEKHLAAKELHYTKNDPTLNKAAVNKCKRLLKYIGKGFSIDDRNLKMFLKQAVEDHGKK